MYYFPFQHQETHLKCNHYTFFTTHFCKARIHKAWNKVEYEANKAKGEETSDIQPVTINTSSSQFCKEISRAEIGPKI